MITTAAGSATDPDGYILLLNGVEFGPMGIADTLVLRNLPAAEYAVGLAGVASHCDNGGGNPRGVRVDGGRTSRVIFQVKCRSAEPLPGPSTQATPIITPDTFTRLALPGGDPVRGRA